jgi:hypothetical protein
VRNCALNALERRARRAGHPPIIADTDHVQLPATRVGQTPWCDLARLYRVVINRTEGQQAGIPCGSMRVVVPA